MDLLKTIYKKIFFLFFKKKAVESIPLNLEKTPREELGVKRKREGKKSENFGSMYYLGSLINNLDDYFYSMTGLKKDSPDCYNLARSFGGQVFNGDILLDRGNIHPNFLKNMPSFAMIHLSRLDKEERQEKEGVANLSLIYIIKKKPPFDCEKTNGQVYELGLFFDDRHYKSKWHGVMKSYISIDSEGSIRALRQVMYSPLQVHHRGNRAKGTGGSSTVPRYVFGYDIVLKSMVKEWNEKKEKSYDVHDVVNTFASICINTFSNSISGFQIRVEKKSVFAVFNIDILRTPYFFKDRELTVNKNGFKMKIFHIVRTHKRKTGQIIKTHFRGLRKFIWNGYNITIMHPKQSLETMEAHFETTVIMDTEEIPINMITTEEMGNKIVKALSN